MWPLKQTIYWILFIVINLLIATINRHNPPKLMEAMVETWQQTDLRVCWCWRMELRQGTGSEPLSDTCWWVFFQPFPGSSCQQPAGNAPVSPAPMADVGWGALGKKRALLPFLADMAKGIRVTSRARGFGVVQVESRKCQWSCLQSLGKKPAWATSCCLHPHTSAVGSSPVALATPSPSPPHPFPPAGESQLPQVSSVCFTPSCTW